MNSNPNASELPIRKAGLVCLVCLPIIYLATRPMVWVLHAEWVGWLLAPLFTLLPMSVSFIILYSSLWHREWPGPKRILSLILVSAIILCVVLFIMGVILVIGSFFPDLGRYRNFD
jgi:hypothetical protein